MWDQVISDSVVQPDMLFRFLAASLCVSTPLLVLFSGETGQSFLSASHHDGATGNHAELGPHRPVISVLGDEVVETGERPSTTSCPPCQCPECLLVETGPRGPPPHVTIIGRLTLQLLYEEQVSFDRLVLGFLLLYGAGAAVVGWAIAAARAASRRASSLASQGHRPRGAGYRAGLSAPSGLR